MNFKKKQLAIVRSNKRNFKKLDNHLATVIKFAPIIYILANFLKSTIACKSLIKLFDIAGSRATKPKGKSL